MVRGHSDQVSGAKYKDTKSLFNLKINVLIIITSVHPGNSRSCSGGFGM